MAKPSDTTDLPIPSPKHVDHTEIKVEVTKTTVTRTEMVPIAATEFDAKEGEVTDTAAKFHIVYEKTLGVLENFQKETLKNGEIDSKDVQGDLQANAKVLSV